MKTRHSSAGRIALWRFSSRPSTNNVVTGRRPKYRHRRRRDYAKYRESGSATESSTPALFPERGWPAAPHRDHGTIGMSDARSTVLETWRTRVEPLRRPVGRGETQ